MSNTTVPLNEKGFALFFSGVSRGLKLVPPLNDLIVGNNNIPRGWFYLPEAAENYKPWVAFEGDPNGTKWPFPRLYNFAGIVAVSTLELQTLKDTYPNAQEALAVKLGHAVVVGAFAEDLSFAPNGQGGQRRLAGTRIASGDTAVKAGVWIPDEHRFIGAETTTYYDRRELNRVPPAIPIA